MEDFDVVTELRAKWCCILEDELECPICFEMSASAEIIQCINSHNVCSNCRVNLLVCPTCDGQFITTRNRVMEKLIKQFGEMKSSLMDPESDKYQRINSNKKSVSCQTDPEPKIVTASVKSQTDTKIQRCIDTQTDFLEKETNQSNNSTDPHNGDKVLKNNVVSSMLPKLEVVAEEVKPPLRRSTRIKSKISRYSINQR
ncbi:hypothetical protein HCN44_008649 [Aphidius gifuensis]|uniref:E3 ubiquitin-protein ligase Sina-like RING finger domain-containing protein n=1 Tax=Aphidius gifuensis TaxID=684658 RepID=A0A835CR99_APHGI|nr:uncharacterized protein LOC122858392 isoform X3 [Aphidius gifuensis]KAF7989975.1 hypothetical protein HCN44_008649 [Aphidius gifuensis]